mmetsp:Transcript_38585/g.46677  ORF Transcript_38585/g.46677 Transcript_38585/m.46677 type:complete len:119 (+) Transcript_38585:72-428(+)|eukprot:CAMPEP_0197867082 /NCGR_PEP_ID=MMETSP1438-20131217/44564_1 /TAXON_ID=1461541 /ORGANISM="Pterosperma sp., Strain CCMP1384" /LENGTH=118 /DNA_ID=CAMNT_0043485703 /DNA_START=68 /DNA_END=424 /DNA_ORIENTATION=+
MSSTLQQLQHRKERLEEELRHVEKQVYDLETSYLNDSSQYGNVLKGFEGFLAPSKNQSVKKTRNFKTEDRLFSLSSMTSPAAEELAAGLAERETSGLPQSKRSGLHGLGGGRSSRTGD